MDDQPPPQHSPEPPLPAARVAAILRVTLRTLSNWEARGLLIPMRRCGRRYYEAAEVRRLWCARFDIVLIQSSERIE